MILNDIQIRKMILERDLIVDYIDLDKQIQPHGFDLTVKQVYGYVPGDSPVIDFSNELRKLPDYEPKESLNGHWFLDEGTYLIEFNEFVKIPSNMVAIGIHRSTIIRCDCLTAMGYWDAGYEGRGITRLEVGKNGLVLYRNARVTQLIFIKTDAAEELYDGVYRGEKIQKRQIPKIRDCFFRSEEGKCLSPEIYRFNPHVEKTGNCAFHPDSPSFPGKLLCEEFRPDWEEG